MKGQLEMFGLAIVFVLILLGILLYFKFSGEKETVAEDFYFTQLPTRILNTMTETTTACKDQKIEILISNIASYVDMTPNYPNLCLNYTDERQIDCKHGNYRSYEELFNSNDGAVVNILKNSLEYSKIQYEF